MPYQTFVFSLHFLPSCFSFFFAYHLCFSLCFLFLSMFSFFLVFPLLFTMHNEGLFILSAMIRFIVLPFNYLWPSVGLLPRPPTGLLAAQPPPPLCASHTTFHSQTKGVLFYFLALRGIPIRIRVGYSLLLTPMACT